MLEFDKQKRVAHPPPFGVDHELREKAYLECIDKLVTRLCEHQNVAAIWIHGSRGRGNHSPSSDLDVSIACHGGDTKSVYEISVDEIGPPINLFDFYGEEVTEGWFFRGFEVGLRIMQAHELADITSRFFDSIDRVDRDQDFIRHVILSGRSVLDEVRFLETLKASVRSMPEEIQIGLFDRHLGRALQMLSWFESRPPCTSPFQHLRRANFVIDSLSRAAYASLGLLYIRGMKYLVEDLSDMGPVFIQSLLELTYPVSSPSESRDWNRQAGTVARQLFDRFQDRFEGIMLSERVTKYKWG